MICKGDNRISDAHNNFNLYNWKNSGFSFHDMKLFIAKKDFDPMKMSDLELNVLRGRLLITRSSTPGVYNVTKVESGKTSTYAYPKTRFTAENRENKSISLEVLDVNKFSFTDANGNKYEAQEKTPWREDSAVLCPPNPDYMLLRKVNVFELRAKDRTGTTRPTGPLILFSYGVVYEPLKNQQDPAPSF